MRVMSFGREETVARYLDCVECGREVDPEPRYECHICGDRCCELCIDQHCDECEHEREQQGLIEDINVGRGRRGLSPITSGTVTP